MFSTKFLVLSRFSHFWGQIHAVFGPGQIKFKSPGFFRFHCACCEPCETISLILSIVL